MKLYRLIALVIALSSVTACNNWIYRIDVPQGNFLDLRDVKKLRVGMSKEQVIYVLGHPVMADTFDDNTWYYVYDMKRGMSNRGADVHQELIIQFEDNKITEVTGDFELPEEFYTPIDQ